jgi:hypothetical protein
MGVIGRAVGKVQGKRGVPLSHLSVASEPRGSLSAPKKASRGRRSHAVVLEELE